MMMMREELISHRRLFEGQEDEASMLESSYSLMD